MSIPIIYDFVKPTHAPAPVPQIEEEVLVW